MVPYRQALANQLAALARLQRELRQPAEAVAAALERRGLWPHDPNQLSEVASDIARAIPLVGQGQTALRAEDQALRRQYADQAIAVLEQALAHGLRDADPLKHPAFAPLQSREEFRQLVARVEGMTRTK